MDTHANDEVDARLDRLEREMRWWRRAAAVAGAVLGLVTLVGATTPKAAPVIEAEKFVVRDANGNVRAVLGPEDSRGLLKPDSMSLFGEYGLHLYDSDGTYRAGLRENDGSDQSWELVLNARKTHSGANLLVLENQALFVLRATEQTREAAERESTELVKKLNAAKTAEEKGKLLLSQRFNGVRASLMASPRGPNLGITDEHGRERAVLGATALETIATGTIEQRPASSLVLFDKDGKVLFQAP